ncbi:MAG: TauD/TfdA family dioxygenase [Novosphingobium sp.]|nr:TauD/TfdA family dioxygenase [Novosphingobium sp.]
MTMKIEPITPHIGAFMRVSADDVLQSEVIGRVLEALDRYNVLVFPQIHMSDERFAQFTAALGESHDLGVTEDASRASEKGIYRIALDKDDRNQLDFIKGNDFWHMDGTVYDMPGKATLLKCEVPPSEGGDTGFASLFAAWDALPEERKRELEDKRVLHYMASVGRKMYDAPTAEDFARWDAVFPPTEHPLVWHQKSGRTSLLIGATAGDIVGMAEAEGRALLDELVEWATAPCFTYRHKWQRGDLVIFNNPALLHRSYPYDAASGRVMHRTTLKGTEAIS